MSNRPDILLFDLDGTLTDPGQGITNSVAYALEKFGISVPDRQALYPFIGPPLLESFRKYYGLDETQCREAVAYYREYFAPKGMYENKVYPGIPEMLQALTQAGMTLAVATSKPEPFAKEILRHFGLLPYFTLVAGASLDETRITKTAVVTYALDALGSPAPERCRMIGDRLHDVLGGHACGVETVGVLYGYGSEAELQEAGADAIVATPEELTALFLEQEGR